MGKRQVRTGQTFAVVAGLSQDLVCCVFWNAFLLVMGVKSGYLTWHRLPVCWNQSKYSPLTFLINKASLKVTLMFTECLLFFPYHSVSTLETVVCESPRRSSAANLAPTAMWLCTSHSAQPFSLIGKLTKALNLYVHDFALPCCHTISWLDNCMNVEAKRWSQEHSHSREMKALQYMETLIFSFTDQCQRSKPYTARLSTTRPSMRTRWTSV